MRRALRPASGKDWVLLTIASVIALTLVFQLVVLIVSAVIHPAEIWVLAQFLLICTAVGFVGWNAAVAHERSRATARQVVQLELRVTALETFRGMAIQVGTTQELQIQELRDLWDTDGSSVTA